MTEFSAFRASPSIPTEGHDTEVVADYGPVISLETRGPVEDARRQQEAEDLYAWRKWFQRKRDTVDPAEQVGIAAGDEPNKPNNPGEA